MLAGPYQSNDKGDFVSLQIVVSDASDLT